MRQLRGEQRPFTNSTEFLSALYAAYVLWERRPHGTLQKLKNLYRILVTLPYVERKYTLESFGQDVYLLARHHVEAGAETGLSFRLDRGSTAARRRSNLLVVTSVYGEELTFYGVEFFATANMGKALGASLSPVSMSGPSANR